MHMADALLSPAVGTTFWAATLGTIGYVSRRLKETLDERSVPLMGVLGAFVFAGQMINFTIPGTGSSGHLGGGLLLAAVLGPQAAFLVMASVLTVQALFFADGGLLALGCNIFNLGIYPCFVAYPLIFKPLASKSQGRGRVLFASLLGAIAALQLGAFSVVLETMLSGKSDLPFGTFLLFMQPIHLAIGIVEGVITAGVYGYVLHARPEIVESATGTRPTGLRFSVKSLAVSFLVLSVLTGGVFSWFASTHPDGLEWSIKKVQGEQEPKGQEEGLFSIFRRVQEKTAFLPDYGVNHSARETVKEPEPPWPNVEAGRSLAGIIGAAMVLGMILLIGAGIRAIRSKRY